MKKLYIIAGCNGAGKTTASYTMWPEILDCKEFVNAGEIAKGVLNEEVIHNAKEWDELKRNYNGN